MSYSRYQWIQDLVHALGNEHPLPEVEEFLLGWTFVESSPPGAMYNLLNTTERAHGSTDFNSAHVQNFTSYAQGIDTNAALIRNSPFYRNLYLALKNNDIKALGYGASMSESVSQDLQIWVSGQPNGDSQYPIAVRNASNKGSGDLFPGNKYTREQLIAMLKEDVQTGEDLWNKVKALVLQI